MTDWIIWFIAAGVLVILEMFTGTFYLLMLGFGMVAGGLAALAGLSNALQFVVAAIIGIVTTFLLRHSRFGKFNKTGAARDPNVNLDIGQTLAIDEWKSSHGGRVMARVPYRGAMWDAELAPGETARPGTFVIREIQGSRLIVSSQHSPNN
jgi:membrane protein implicated in regulation of membrane protease activity